MFLNHAFSSFEGDTQGQSRSHPQYSPKTSLEWKHCKVCPLFVDAFPTRSCRPFRLCAWLYFWIVVTMQLTTLKRAEIQNYLSFLLRCTWEGWTARILNCAHRKHCAYRFAAFSHTWFKEPLRHGDMICMGPASNLGQQTHNCRLWIYTNSFTGRLMATVAKFRNCFYCCQVLWICQCRGPIWWWVTALNFQKMVHSKYLWRLFAPSWKGRRLPPMSHAMANNQTTLWEDVCTQPSCLQESAQQNDCAVFLFASQLCWVKLQQSGEFSVWLTSCVHFG